MGRLTVAYAATVATPFYLPVADRPETANEGELAVGSLDGHEELLVFHDRPVPFSDDLAAIAWLFHLTPAGAVAGLAMVFVVEDDRELSVNNVYLVEGTASQATRRVLAGLRTGSWRTARRRTFPGDPESRTWRGALARAAKAELRDGSLGQVRILRRE